MCFMIFFFFSSRRRHTRSLCDWSSDVCSSDLSALALERFVMGGGPRSWPQEDSPAELVAEVEGHLRAMLRDVLCGYLDSDLKGVADDILLETHPEPFMEIQARDLRAEAAEQPRAEVPGAPPVTEPEPQPAEPEPQLPEQPDPVPAAPEPDTAA